MSERGVVVNETNLPDDVVTGVVRDYIEENASLLGVSSGSSFSTYTNRSGSLLARSAYRPPANIFDEIALARSLAERDDDVGSAMGFMMNAAFGLGMQNTHKDERTVALYDEAAKHANLDMMFKEIYREYLIAAQFTTVEAFTRESFQFQPQGADRRATAALVVPLIGVLPAEQIRVLDNDIFRTSRLAYKPATASQETWLLEFFNPSTTAARKAEMRREDPLLTSLVVEAIQGSYDDTTIFYTESDDPPTGNYLFRLNPNMVRRTSMPKGAWKYPRPLLTRNFAMLEAKRLLNIMDHALLQGGANFLVVAKKGTDERPALPQEVEALRETIRHSSRAGVLVGDHRLSIEVITPNLSELLNPEKRNLLGRKLTMALQRIPEHATSDPAAEGMRAEVEFVQAVMEGDRLDIRRHVEQIYHEIAKRNSNLTQGAAGLWFPKIVLQGTQYFTDFVLKLRDRGDISRKSTVEAAGFSYEAEVEQRRREKANGDDRALTPPPVPFTGGPGGAPADNGGGRPAGGSPANGAPGSQPGRSAMDPARRPITIQRNAGETVKAMLDEELGTYRIGEITYAIMDEFAETTEVGRVTAFERRALDKIDDEWGIVTEGPLTLVPVNPDYEIDDLKALRLAPGLSMIVGKRLEDGAAVARALCFREPYFRGLDAEERALQWGFPPRPELESGE